MPSSAFLQIELPTSATWLYATLVVAVALFYQFSRIFALRNFDLIGLFFFAPGFLILEDAHRSGDNPVVGYAWLLGVSMYWFVRCLIDPTAVKKPRIAPNLGTAGLFWLGGMLLLGLCIAAGVAQQAHPEPVPVESMRRGVERGIAVTCQVVVVVLLVLIGRIHFQQWATGALAGTLYLLLPYTAWHFGQSHHVWPAAFTLAAVMAYRKPAVAGGFLGFAAGTSFFPVLLLPAWFQFYRGRGAGSFLTWFGIVAGISLAGTIVSLAIANPNAGGFREMLALSSWQPWNVPAAEGIWTGAQWAYRLPVFIAFFGFVIGAFFWPTSRDLGQLLAASSAILISVQFWLADGGGRYVLWYCPLLILMALRPTTVDLQPPTLSGTVRFGWLRRTKPVTGPPSPSLAV